jgi:nicotinate phosphoribosyltransferase
MTSLLATDGYKFSMAEAGVPLRKETFYYTHRKGGPQILPIDVKGFIARLIPEPKKEDYDFLDKHEYEMGVGYKAAMLQLDKVVVNSLPKGSIFYDREPVFSITGPSAIVSWLEPLILGELNYRIQIATSAILDSEAFAADVATVTCTRQAEIVKETMDSLSMRTPEMKVDPERYFANVLATAKRLVEIVKDPLRLFEVGLRSATCLEQHEIALRACLAAGITRTSNCYFAHKLGMVPVGTMGHEHVQRYGSDIAAFRVMRDRRPYRSSYLLDTYDTFLSGIPAAYAIMAEDPDRGDSIRFDSGDKMSQYLYAISKAKAMKIRPKCILEDSFNDTLTAEFELSREQVGWKPSEQYYGYGGHIVASTAFTKLTRDRVAAVWKLSQTGETPTMKFGNEPGHGKESLPGNPVVFRHRNGSKNAPVGIIGQQSEEPPEGYSLETGAEGWVGDPSFSLKLAAREGKFRITLSPETQAIRTSQYRLLQQMKSHTGAKYESVLL